ncbi:cell division protein ZipA C-terminal FtsZ-binding domain-containing protein [Marinicella sp. S1101]|uniref:cell division protein ZipA C-terminal FtsZ-binding domain-containing protein n=1 Tax=Marinicella marina TaxID=2996016 RepID=UPI002260FBA6|nr:cell division protein ZipA C-terminal FtsZ-binding domain-containing protein [Marinicella marina]MCX7552706.1 cell division protein ZipA C-terminal FtsZ-binding domain-containing protein [Marinicella marina]MDJ1139985.1 cell division protein ZipA C-terminal FtsZ-binding domain-containing protein [Marinicella marina]
MSAFELRIIIFVIGLLVLGLIYFMHTRKPSHTRAEISEDELFQIEPEINVQETETAVSSQSEQQPEKTSERKLVTLFLHAKDGLQFDWHQIKDASAKAGLEYGEDHLFYRYRRIGTEKKALFLVANMLKPGVFDPDLRTTGLVFIMTLPGEMNALDLWDTMFPVAKRMEELLDGSLTDENHSSFSRQRIASMREEMRAFESTET